MRGFFDGPGVAVRPTLLGRLADLVVGHPRAVLGAWLVAIALLAGLGLDLDQKLTTQPIYVDGSATLKAHEASVREFGDDESLIVLLRGAPAKVELQGTTLERRLRALPRTLVLSPWDRGGAIDGLRPSARQAALLVGVDRRPGEGVADVLDSVEGVVGRTVHGGVRVSVAGAPAIIESFRSASARAVTVGERIALPILLLVLLLVFRSVLAALIPVVVGGAVVAATQGVLALLLSTVRIDAFALGAVGMMGLALGVDYSLLMVSRFRDELGEGDDVAAAVRSTVIAAGRSVIPAGCGLVLAMLVASQVLASTIVVSVAIAIATAAILSMVSAICMVPAALALLGTRLDRWALPRRAGKSTAATWSRRLSSRPLLLALPIGVLLLAAAALAFNLQTGAGTVGLLPPGDAGRQQQEDVQEALGPGWVSPIELVVDGRGTPVTTPSRLRALASFQRTIEEDPDVQVTAGLAGIADRTDELAGRLHRGLAAQGSGLARLKEGLGRAYGGAARGSTALVGAADGARKLGSAIGATSAGAGLLAQGLRATEVGSQRLDAGLQRAATGGDRLARGDVQVRQGAKRLSSGLAKARKQAGELAGSTRLLRHAMSTGNRYLAEADAPLQGADNGLDAAEEALKRMTAGRGDPEWTRALDSVRAVRASLAGSEEEEEAGVATAVERAEGQFSLGTYLVGQLRKAGKQAAKGMTQLADGAERLHRGARRLSAGDDRFNTGLDQLARGGAALSPALQRLQDGAAHLGGALREVEGGAGRFAAGLAGGARRSESLADGLGRIHAAIARQDAGDPSAQLARQSPGFLRSGYLYLAALDGSEARRRSQSAFVVSLDRGGLGARVLVIPRFGPASPEAGPLRERIEARAESLARRTGTTVLVGGVLPNQMDVNSAFRDEALVARLALALVTFLVLVPVVRAIVVPLIAALLNLVTVAATFGILSLLFNGSLLGGPGYVDAAVVPATVMVIFGLAIDYEVFILARVREEYVRTGSPLAAIDGGIERTAHVVTGAASIMLCVFLIFSLSTFATLRDFGVAQAIAVFIDAFVIRLVILPALLRALGPWAWWMPAWLGRLLPGGWQPLARPAEGKA